MGRARPPHALRATADQPRADPPGGPQAEGPTITAADTVELIPGLPFLRFPIGRAYLWHGDCGLTP
jgi:hypothetical protein